MPIHTVYSCFPTELGSVTERDLMVHKAKIFTTFPFQKSLQTPDSLDNVHNIDMIMNKLLINKKLNQRHRTQPIKILVQFGQPHGSEVES